MKTRIISGSLVIAFCIALFAVQLKVPFVFWVAVGVFSAVAVLEMLYYTKICNNKVLVGFSMAFAAFMPFIMGGYVPLKLAEVYIIFCVIILLMGLKWHNTVSLTALAAALGFSLILPAALSYLALVTQFKQGCLFYILLVICFSAVSDTGAYFTGVFFGKHKMSPVISPKKTWEGLAGGYVWGIIGTLIVCAVYHFLLGYNINYLAALLPAPVFITLGVLGDLTASMIKRHCSVKDYGKLIPGHGGVMDRFDSIMMIVPVFYMYISHIDIIK